MKKSLLILLALIATPSYASNVEGLYWYAENKIIIQGKSKEGMIIKNNTVEIVSGNLKPYITCKIDSKTSSKLVFTCKTPKVTKTIEYNVVEEGNYLFVDDDPDNGGYIKD